MADRLNSFRRATGKKAFKMLPGHMRMKVAVSWEFPQLCSALMFSRYSLRKESVISMYLGKKNPCLLSFCSQSQVTLNDAACCSQAERGWPGLSIDNRSKAPIIKSASLLSHWEKLV